MGTTPAVTSEAAISAFVGILGRSGVLTSARATAPYVKGGRFGGGRVLAVLRPRTLVEAWRALQVCVKHDLIVIPQAANTGLTGGSGPGDLDYDREVVIISTLRINQIYPINSDREVVCLAGATLFELEDALEPLGREPHSVIGSTSVGASVVGGIANNSGGVQVRKGPAYTRYAVYARVNAEGTLELINHLGIELGEDPEQLLEALQRGDWDPSAVTPPPPDGTSTEYSDHVRQIVPSPARYNADPTFLHEASGSAGKIMVFAVRTRTFPKDFHTTTFYIGTNAASELEELRRVVLATDGQLPISGEYLGRTAFDLAEKYGRDTYLGLKYAGSKQVRRLFALKNWANELFARLPFFGPTFGDTVAQRMFSILPTQLPRRMIEFRDRFEHHLLMEVSQADADATEHLLRGFFAEPGRGGSFFVCTEDEAKSAALHRFGASSAITRYFNMHRDDCAGMVTFDVALRRDDEDWLEVLPAEISDKLAASAYFGHFFCHVMHQNHVVKKGVDTTRLKRQMSKLLTDRGATLPAEHNFGRIYKMPAELEAHFRELDPWNVFNPGIGGTSPRKHWA